MTTVEQPFDSSIRNRLVYVVLWNSPEGSSYIEWVFEDNKDAEEHIARCSHKEDNVARHSIYCMAIH